jgi:hypothetical protein
MTGLRFVCLMSFLGLLFVTGCNKQNDPRCSEVAESSKMAAVAELEKRYGGEELESLLTQLDEQMPKVEKQCQEMLADDDSGLWDRWADCMVAATAADEVLKCKSVK